MILREVYEQAARASQVLGDDKALKLGKRALRLLPENPFLLAMMADLAARHGQHELAETSGRQALRYLERALPPAAVSPDAWPQARDCLRNLAGFALGHTAEEESRYEDAERWLLEALRAKPNDYVALYALGVARFESKDMDSAAPCFAEVMKAASGALSDAGRRLQQIYTAKIARSKFRGVCRFATLEHAGSAYCVQVAPPSRKQRGRSSASPMKVVARKRPSA